MLNSDDNSFARAVLVLVMPPVTFPDVNNRSGVSGCLASMFIQLYEMLLMVGVVISTISCICSLC